MRLLETDNAPLTLKCSADNRFNLCLLTTCSCKHLKTNFSKPLNKWFIKQFSGYTNLGETDLGMNIWQKAKFQRVAKQQEYLQKSGNSAFVLSHKISYWQTAKSKAVILLIMSFNQIYDHYHNQPPHCTSAAS